MAKNFEVLIAGMAFDQHDIKINAGDTVTWINDDGSTHSVTTDPGSSLSVPEIVLSPNTYSARQTFPTAGKFSYHCKYHGMMKGSVTVA